MNEQNIFRQFSITIITTILIIKIITITTTICDDHKHDNRSNNPRTKLSSVIGRSLTGRITPTKVKLQKRPVQPLVN